MASDTTWECRPSSLSLCLPLSSKAILTWASVRHARFCVTPGPLLLLFLHAGGVCGFRRIRLFWGSFSVHVRESGYVLEHVCKLK